MAIPELTFPIIIGGALVDSINPCVIGVLILLITVLVRQKDKRKLLITGSMYIVGVYLTYFIAGITLLEVFTQIREIPVIATYFYSVIGLVIIGAGLLEVKDFFWYGKGFSLAIPKTFISFIERTVKKSHSSIWSALLFGVIVTLVELPCTGAPYLAVITVMTNSSLTNPEAIGLLLLYNLVFVAPLIAIIYLAYRGTSTSKLEAWRKEHRGLMRLLLGLFIVALGIWIITFVFFNLLVPLILSVLVILGIMALFWKIGQLRSKSQNSQAVVQVKKTLDTENAPKKKKTRKKKRK